MSKRKEVYDQTKSKIPFDEFCREYFWHPAGDALRINQIGLQYFRMYIPCHQVDVIKKLDKSKMAGKHFIFLARFCRRPYYIGTNKIFFFDDEEAFLFKLCDGDIDNVKEVAPKKLK